MLNEAERILWRNIAILGFATAIVMAVSVIITTLLFNINQEFIQQAFSKEQIPSPIETSDSLVSYSGSVSLVALVYLLRIIMAVTWLLAVRQAFVPADWVLTYQAVGVLSNAAIAAAVAATSLLLYGLFYGTDAERHMAFMLNVVGFYLLIQFANFAQLLLIWVGWRRKYLPISITWVAFGLTIGAVITGATGVYPASGLFFLSLICMVLSTLILSGYMGLVSQSTQVQATVDTLSRTKTP